MEQDDFYLRFENRFRGSMDLIESRLKAYLPFLDLIRGTGAESPRALDLGSGRGEWLGLLGQVGFMAEGVDNNEAMVAHARSTGLVCHHLGALEFLRTQPDEQYSMVSAFHLVEHVPLQDLPGLLREMVRVLAPGGCLLLETPNPENLRVATWSFYLDPTHHRPIPAPLLEFMVQETGCLPFTFRTNGAGIASEEGELAVALETMLSGSPDYSIFGLKQPSKPVSVSFASLVAELSQGRPDDETRVRRASHSLEARLRRAENTEVLMEKGLTKIEESLSTIENRLVTHQHLKERNDSLLRDLHETTSALTASRAQHEHWQHRAHELQAQADQLGATVAAMKASTSWKVTKPLRFLSPFVKPVLGAPLSLLRAAARPVLSASMKLAMRSNLLKSILLRLLRHVPGLEHHLRLFALNQGFVVASTSGASGGSSDGHSPKSTVPEKPVRFEDLAAVCLMDSVARLGHRPDQPNVTFLIAAKHD